MSSLPLPPVGPQPLRPPPLPPFTQSPSPLSPVGPQPLHRPPCPPFTPASLPQPPPPAAHPRTDVGHCPSLSGTGASSSSSSSILHLPSFPSFCGIFLALLTPLSPPFPPPSLLPPSPLLFPHPFLLSPDLLTSFFSLSLKALYPSTPPLLSLTLINPSNYPSHPLIPLPPCPLPHPSPYPSTSSFLPLPLPPTPLSLPLPPCPLPSPPPPPCPPPPPLPHPSPYPSLSPPPCPLPPLPHPSPYPPLSPPPPSTSLSFAPPSLVASFGSRTPPPSLGRLNPALSRSPLLVICPLHGLFVLKQRRLNPHKQGPETRAGGGGLLVLLPPGKTFVPRTDTSAAKINEKRNHELDNRTNGYIDRIRRTNENILWTPLKRRCRKEPDLSLCSARIHIHTFRKMKMETMSNRREIL
ncbi:hypothetical protein C7M84_011559 [Penaeus vannamei]|uniref:Uncharacterized protein n=1 Tax=Penaeus vannamei TaxID=6689 RepID=A0A423T133_PENVA|nr:hypothetical protein C7M84_011559 [Penaeus vannamei]